MSQEIVLSTHRPLLDVVLEVGGLAAQPGHAKQGTYFLKEEGIPVLYVVEVTVTSYPFTQTPAGGQEQC